MTQLRCLVLLGTALAAASCRNQESSPKPATAWVTEPLAAIRTSGLAAGPANPPPEIRNPYAGQSDALVQGRQLFTSFNCAGCHGSAGGGGIGPPLADDDWIYGGSDAQIYASVVQGRPNGMPAFGPMLAGEAVWKVAAYVRSLRQAAESGMSRRE